MLDDVFTELDAQRAQGLFDAVAPDVQCLLTTTDLGTDGTPPGRDVAEFFIDGGELEARGR